MSCKPTLLSTCIHKSLTSDALSGAKDHVRLEDELIQSFKTNVVGNIHLFNLFLPLILKGNTKKIITISSGMADIELARNHKVYEAGPYAISKVAMNMASAKYSAEYAKDGVLFLNICPGVVDTGHNDGSKL